MTIRRWPFERVGASLDRALGDNLGLTFDPRWHPALWRRRRWGRWQRLLGGAVVVGALAVAPVAAAPMGTGHQTLSDVQLAGPTLSAPVSALIRAAGGHAYAVEGMSPVYADVTAGPTGHCLEVAGQFTVNGTRGTSLTLDVNTGGVVTGGLLLNQGVPVYAFEGPAIAAGAAVPAVAPVGPLPGHWVQGGSLPISSFSAAGSDIYLTHDTTWTVLRGGRTAFWAASPGSAGRDTVAALPAAPAVALLLRRNPTGGSVGYVTRDRGRSWVSWHAGLARVDNVVSMGHQFWAIMNGTLVSSRDGMNWHRMLRVNTARWQVADYAVDPANLDQVVVALAPVAGDGIGPVLETADGGITWRDLPHFPALGAVPSSMVMTPGGNIAALVNLSNPVLVRYSMAARRWSVLPVPARQDGLGIGRLASDPAGDLIYGAPGGALFRWSQATNVWQTVLPPPGAGTVPGRPAGPLEAIGTDQVLAGYANGWWIYVIEPGSQARPG